MEPIKILSYQFIEKIDEGGGGIVYKAVDQTAENIVAIKTLKEQVDKNSETFIRFKKEADLLAKLDHPNILKFIDFIEKDSQVFIVTEFLEGKNLRQVIDEKNLILDERIEIILQIAQALDYVHSQGIIHRDIKPSNVMIVGKNTAKILDFGVANLLNFQRLFTAKEGVVGSFSYMSPEQGGMLKRAIDQRADLYSLGILFYQLVSGILPYQAKEIGELLHQHIAKIPEEPINLEKELSPIINKIILKLIKKDPDDRYQTAYGLSEDLNFYLNLNADQKKTFYLELGKKDRLKNLNYRTSLVGRKNEMKILLEHLNNTVLKKGFASVLIGKSGQGKSRLLYEVQKYTSSKNAFFIFTASNERDKNQPYFPFIEAVKKTLDILYKQPEAKRKEIFDRLKKNLGDEGRILSKIIPELSHLLGEYDPSMKFSKKESDVFFEKLKDFFVAVSSDSTPLVFAMDDVHHWDQGSIQFFSYMLPLIYRESIFFILAMREEEAVKVKDLYQLYVNAAKEDKFSIISLNNLNVDHIENLLVEIFGTLYTGLKEVSSRLAESTQGNPLLIIENIKTLVEEDIIVQKKDGWSINLEKFALFRFSSSIMDRILNRLSKIDPITKDILSYAAILGKEFNFDILFRMIQKNEPAFFKEKLLDYLKTGIESGLIMESLNEKGETRYAFAHDKVTETLISQLSEQQIKDNHYVAAIIIENEYFEKDKEYHLAYHYLMADKRNKAFQYNNSAGKKAIESFSYKLAVSFFYQALNILRKFAQKTDRAIKERIKLSLEIVNLHFQLGELKEGVILLEEILPLAEMIQDKMDMLNIYYLLGKMNYFSGNQPKALEYYNKVIPIGEALNKPELLAVPYLAIGRANCFIGYFKESIEYIKKGLVNLSKNEILEQIYSLGIIGQSYGALGMKKEAMEKAAELTQNYLNTPNELFNLYANFFAASIETMVGDPEKSLSECQKCYEAAKDMKNPTVEINALFNVGRSYGSMNKLEEAIKNVAKAVHMSKEMQIFVGLSLTIFYLAEMYILLGNTRVGRECINEAEKYAGVFNPLLMKQWKKRLLALSELYSHNPDLFLALDQINESIQACEELGEDYTYNLCYCKIVKACILWKATDKLEEAQKLYDESVAFFVSRDLINDIQYSERLLYKFSPEFTAPVRETTTHPEFETTKTHTMTFTQTEFSYERQLRYLLKLSEQLAQVHEMGMLLPKIMALAIEVSGAERGILFLYEDNHLVVKAKTSIDPNEERGEMAYSPVLLEQTLKEGKGQLIMDAQNELQNDQTVSLNRMKSIITVPLMTTGKVLGAIYLDNRQVKGLFTEENFELLKAFSVEAAISIENARLYRQVQEQAKLEQEMEIAKDIQTSILPVINDSNSYEISAFMKTATEVGGDYYDFFLESKPYFGVFGDVSGHGLKSGIIMMMAEVVFNALMRDEDMKQKDLPLLYQIINSTLFENIQKRLSKKSNMGHQYSHLYMTFRMFRFDDDGNFEMFGNDHAEPFICRADTGEVQTIRSTGFLIGIMEDGIMNGKTFKFKLNPGDLLILYSDGITEAKKEAKSKVLGKDRKVLMFGEERLHQTVAQNRAKTPQEIINCVIDEVSNWMAEQEDDITMAVIKMK